jgi:predicted transcriptional regulator
MNRIMSMIDFFRYQEQTVQALAPLPSRQEPFSTYRSFEIFCIYRQINIERSFCDHRGQKLCLKFFQNLFPYIYLEYISNIYLKYLETKGIIKMKSEKEILLSVKEVYAELLISGAKTIELRRRFPTNLQEGTRLWLYSSGGRKVVIGSCLIKKIERMSINELWKVACVDAMISWADFKAYFHGVSEGVAIYIQSPSRLDKPIKLSEIEDRKKLSRPPQSFCYI